MPGSTLGRGNILAQFLIGPTLTPVSVAASTAAEQNFTIRGLQLNDSIQINSTVIQTAGLGIANARVSAADTLTVLFSNSTAGALVPVAGIYLLDVNRPENLPLPTNAI